jgi:MEMO1 family protein
MAGPKDGGGAAADGAGDARDSRATPEPQVTGERIRPPAVAGLFYPAKRDACLAEARELMNRGADAAAKATKDLAIGEGASRETRRARGAIVPHAGWICSGAIAAESIAAIDTLGGASTSQRPAPPDIVVVFGAVPTPLEIEYAALDTHAVWAEPFEQSRVAGEVRAKLLGSGAGGGGAMFVTDDRFHRREHAVEVELPLIEVAWPGTVILPVEVPTVEHAWRIGVETALRVAEARYTSPVFLASSDLTHYGPAYNFAPCGVGLTGLAWARDNDRRVLDLVERCDVERIVPEVRKRMNACGGGAIAATLAACRELGATHARVLRHANSYETFAAAGVRGGADAADNAVGYASVVVW